MQFIEGDLKLYGWELRQHDPGVITKLGPLATSASSLMSVVDSVAENIGLHDGVKILPPIIYREDEDRFLRFGLIGPNFISVETVVEGLQGTPDEKEALAEELYRRARCFRDLSQRELLGAASLEPTSPNNSQWGLVRYKPQGSMSGLVDGRPTQGHHDHQPVGTIVKSTQLTDAPAIWRLNFVVWPGYEKASAEVVQQKGQVMVMKASHRQARKGSATPWHFVQNDSAEERLSLLELELSERNQAKTRVATPTKHRVRWPFRRHR